MYRFDHSHREQFDRWLNLKLSSIGWEGKHRQTFDQFWDTVFLENQDGLQILERINFARRLSQTGPLYSWFGWLRDRFIVYSFMASGLTLQEFSRTSGVSESWLAHLLRDYFLSFLPELQTEANELFDVGSLVSPGRRHTYLEFAKAFGVTGLPRHGDEEDMMLGLEVTLFPQWTVVLKELKKDLYQLRFDWEKLRRYASLRRQLRFLREVAVLLTVSLALIVGLRYSNSWYEASIIKRIKLLEPTFFGLDLSMLYRPEDRSQRMIELSNEEIEKLERIEGAKSFDEIKDVRFDPESDEVALTSVDDIPAFTADGSVTSEYEETNKGGYRDAGGRNKAYRVLMASVSPRELRDRILAQLAAYDAAPLGKVKPGTNIPGGMYFNLVVPSSKLRAFLGTVSGMGEATIFESNSREATPAGKNRVFIWVKSI